MEKTYERIVEVGAESQKALEAVRMMFQQGRFKVGCSDAMSFEADNRSVGYTKGPLRMSAALADTKLTIRARWETMSWFRVTLPLWILLFLLLAVLISLEPNWSAFWVGPTMGAALLCLAIIVLIRVLSEKSIRPTVDMVSDNAAAVAGMPFPAKCSPVKRISYSRTVPIRGTQTEALEQSKDFFIKHNFWITRNDASSFDVSARDLILFGRGMPIKNIAGATVSTTQAEITLKADFAPIRQFQWASLGCVLLVPFVSVKPPLETFALTACFAAFMLAGGYAGKKHTCRALDNFLRDTLH